MAFVRLMIPLMLLALAACASPDVASRIGPDGKPLPAIYNITAGSESTLQFRMLDGVNALRQAAGLAPVELDAQLNAAAATHSRDMSVQNRPWHFGSDGSSPIDRVRRVGFRGQLLGENISETYEDELETLTAWMQVPETRDVIMDRNAQLMGFSWFQEPNGKIWWTLVTGTNARTGSTPIPAPLASVNPDRAAAF